MTPPKPATKEEKKRKVSVFAKRFTIAFTLVVLVVQFFMLFERFDNAWIDQLYRWRGMEKGDSRITVVTIDDTSLKKVGSYPWPRSVYARFLREIWPLGVKVVGFDIMFLDPSTPAEDQALIEAVQAAGEKIVLGGPVESDNEEWKQKTRWTFGFPFEKLHKVTKSFGLVTQAYIDADGSVRVVPFMMGRSGDQQLRDSWLSDPERQSTFGNKVLSVFEGRSPDEYPKLVGANQIRLNLRGSRPETIELIPQDDGTLKPHVVPGKEGFAMIPAWRVLERQLNAAEKEQLKGGIVLLGSTASGAFDHFPTAFDGSTPGVLFHANFIDNVLNRRYLHSVPTWVVFLLIVLFAVLGNRIVRLNALLAGAAFVALMAGWVGACYFSFLKLYVLEFWGPAVTLLGVFLALIVHKAMLESQQKREVRQMFGQYVAPEVVDILVKDPDKLQLGGQKRDMTMFFLDIAHFTTISEKMTPENLIQFLNVYLSALTDDILRNNGVVDKYIGDCIMAFWNAPIDEPQHRRKACLAAVDCLNTIQRLNKEYVDPTIPEKPAVRIGLNSGEVVVGNTGSARKLAYTVLGDDVNLASRLEGANKFFGSTVMASDDTLAQAKDSVESRFLGRVRVVGKAIPIGVHELLGRKGGLTKEWTEAMALYLAGMDKFLKRDFEAAKADFQKILTFLPEDKPSKLYLSMCEDYIAIPPPERDDWSVINLTSK